LIGRDHGRRQLRASRELDPAVVTQNPDGSDEHDERQCGSHRAQDRPEPSAAGSEEHVGTYAWLSIEGRLESGGPDATRWAAEAREPDRSGRKLRLVPGGPLVLLMKGEVRPAVTMSDRFLDR
jgi:hypothetical protein